MLSHFPDFAQKNSGQKILMRSQYLEAFFSVLFCWGGVTHKKIKDGISCKGKQKTQQSQDGKASIVLGRKRKKATNQHLPAIWCITHGHNSWVPINCSFSSASHKVALWLV